MSNECTHLSVSSSSFCAILHPSFYVNLNFKKYVWYLKKSFAIIYFVIFEKSILFYRKNHMQSVFWANFPKLKISMRISLRSTFLCKNNNNLFIIMGRTLKSEANFRYQAISLYLFMVYLRPSTLFLSFILTSQFNNIQSVPDHDKYLYTNGGIRFHLFCFVWI